MTKEWHDPKIMPFLKTQQLSYAPRPVPRAFFRSQTQYFFSAISVPTKLFGVMKVVGWVSLSGMNGMVSIATASG